MKRILLVLITFAAIIAGCKKEDKPVLTGNLDVKMSYFYNTYQGYKPDTGAEIYLFKQNGKAFDQDYIAYRIGYLKVVGTGETVQYNFKAEADVSGTAKITGIPYGQYLLVACSEGRNTYSVKTIEINSETKTEVKNFYYLDEFDDDGERW